MGFGFQHRHGTESLSDPVPCKNNCAHGWLPVRGSLHAPNGKVRRVRNLPLRFRLELKASGGNHHANQGQSGH